MCDEPKDRELAPSGAATIEFRSKTASFCYALTRG